ncbi:MAG: glycosyltransferase family 39 protein, partial [Acidimicrobiia bacterium]
MTVQAKRFYLLLGLIVLAGLAVRLGYAVFYKWDQVPWGDALYYHGQANGIVDGKGFINGFIYEVQDVVEIAADHPPLYPLYLAGWTLFGARTFHAHMIASVLLGALTPGVLGLLGRRVAGDRAGLVAAAIAAVYANLWVHDALVTSETITALMVAVAVLMAYRLYAALN